MIEQLQQQQQQQQIMNSIMIANRTKYLSHHHNHHHHNLQAQHHHPQSAIGSSAVTKNSPSSDGKVMSNTGVSGATNSVAAAAMMNNNNNNKAAQVTNGMSSSSSSSAAAHTPSPASPQAPVVVATANKMGSRRIFSPHFKIQVLESYRNDSDCKGNQRATARKYGIHRRQIQKWLQCEAALRTSVSNNSSPSSSSNGGSPPSSNVMLANRKQVDSNNNNNHQRRAPNGPKAASASSSTSSVQAAVARHSVDANHSAAVRLAATAAAAEEASNRLRDCGGVGDTHTRQISMEFFSLTTTSLIINGGAAGGGPDGGRKIESMNEASVPIKPEFGFNAAAAATSSSTSPSSPHPSSLTRCRSSVEMPSTTAAAMLKQPRHDLFQIHDRAEGDAPHRSLISAVPLSPFISTIYGPQGLLAFPTPRLATAGAFAFDYHLPHHSHLSAGIPIDLSMGNTERRHPSPLIHVDDARVPSRSVSGDEFNSIQTSLLSPAQDAAPSSPIDLSCSSSRKRKANVCPVEPVKPPKLFKPYLLDDQEDEEELKVVDDDTEEEARSTASTKEDSFLDQDLTGLKDKNSRRFENPTAVWSLATAQHHQHHLHQYYPGSSPAYESYYYGHENLTLYPSPRPYRYESQSSLSPSTASSPLHHPSRPASLFDSSTSSEAAFGHYHPSSPASSDVRSSPPVFSLDLKLQSIVHPPCNSHWTQQEMRTRLGPVF